MSERFGSSSLRDLPKLRDFKRRRWSSWDRTGANEDYTRIEKGETATIADIDGSGCVTHFWVTMACDAKHFLRKMLLRAFWDGETDPSVEVPIGDFFGIGHAICKNFVSLPLTMSPQSGRGFNCFFPMPFSTGAKLEIANESETDIKAFYYYIDYELHPQPIESLGRFHAQWRRQNPCDGVSDEGMSNEDYLFKGENLSGEGNYVILEAEGKGHYVGLNLNIHNLRKTNLFNWYGEGDDMIFIDGDRTPTINGTGTEDYFNMAYCPATEYNAPYHGLPLPGGPNWSGKTTLYRFHIEDPIYFERSIKVTIEHGHANKRNDDYSSTAYWYQTEPHRRFPEMLPVDRRLPIEET